LRVALRGIRKSKSQSLDASFHAFYAPGVERDRLLKGTSNLEFERTKRILSRFLSGRPLTVIDVGGGPGRYSFWLAGLGHSVHLVDALPLHVRQAEESQAESNHPLVSIRLGDARNLHFEDRYADIVLMFGPLYHLVRKSQRLKALVEAHRVLKRNGLFLGAAVSRFASALDGSVRGFIRDPSFMKIIMQDLRNGQHRNPFNNPRYFTTAFFHHPDELAKEVGEAKFRSVEVYAVTGFGWLLPRFDQIWKNPQLKSRLLTLLERTEREPSLLGQSDHLLAVARK
jgi:ubiquinone/menaquinone biosynthesis C-methylase UbiE